MMSYRSFGFFGLALVVFGILAGVIAGDWTSTYVLVHLLLGGALLALYLFTHVEYLKDSITGRSAKYGTNTVVYSLLTIAVIALLNYVGVQHEWRYDATEQGVFSLAPQSEQILNELDRDVTALAFFRAGEEGRAEDLLDSYDYVTDRFTFEIIDPDKRPELAERHEVTQYGTIVLTAGGESTRVTEADEEAVTNALIRITQADRKRIYYVGGHGEPPLDSRQDARGYGELRSVLENEGYEIEELLLGSVPDVPADADAIIVSAPQRAYLEHELEVLSRYLDRGGRALVMIDPRTGEDLLPLLEARGVTIGDDVIVDQVVQLFGGAQLGVEPIVSSYGSHPITREFGQRTIFSMARSVAPAGGLPDGVSATELARSSDNSWAESDVERLFSASEAGLDDADREGPISVAAAATLSRQVLRWTEPRVQTPPEGQAEGADEAGSAPAGTGGAPGVDGDPPAAQASDSGGAAGSEADDETAGADGQTGEAGGPSDQAAAEAADTAAAPEDAEGRLVVFGDSDWVNNRFIGVYYNEDLLLNAMGWLTGGEELISIRPRRTRSSRIALTAQESQRAFYLTVLLLPELLLFAGLTIWWRRRR